MTEGEHSYTATGRMSRASFSISKIAKWVRNAWCAESDNTVIAGLRKAGLLASSAPELNESRSNSEDEAPAPLAPELAELFQSTSEDEDIEGFK